MKDPEVFLIIMCDIPWSFVMFAHMSVCIKILMNHSWSFMICPDIQVLFVICHDCVVFKSSRDHEKINCYTLSRSRDSPSSVTILWTVGLWWVKPSVLFVIMIIPFTHPSPNSVPPLRFMFPIVVLFHVSILIHIFHSVLFSIPEPEPWPWHMPNSCYPDMFSLVLIRSDPHVCSSVWNQHWLSLELTVQTSKLSSVSHPKFEDSRHLVAQHISWSRVLTENIEPRYAFSPSPAHNIYDL